MTGTSFSPSINPLLNTPQFNTPVPGTRQDQLRDRLGEFLQLTKLTRDGQRKGERYYEDNQHTRSLEEQSRGTSTNSFIASLSAIEKILGDHNFRRALPPEAHALAQEIYLDIVATCGVAAVSGKKNYSRSLQVKQGYEALAGQPGQDTAFAPGLDPRLLYANSPGRNAFTYTETSSLSTKLGLPVDMIMNPNGYGFNQAILGLILRMTKDTTTYDQLKTDSAYEPDGVSKTLSYADLVKKKPGEYTTAEYHAILSAFRAKTGIDNTWSTVDVDSSLVPNGVLLNFFLEEAQSRQNPAERATMKAAVKYLTLAANQGTRDLLAARNLTGAPTLPGAPVDPTADVTAF